ncbi:tripartite tricarboxylate transporter substrate binding protein [Roseococcus sp. SYP-B2431]|uniref:Bug family tripartite tricarboxylate transporter substrate binding protein n=1 Tax=Roseococcus sp. SYP-B2431 TaxID=2496640 RepID=UPI0013F3ADB9|nr:tripartite tricarboxylate transporter substrate-binding protein [Roseococcus sp. SYP-B2431]
MLAPYKHIMRRRALLGAAGAAGFIPASRALPAGTVTIVVPYGAGSTNDIIARLVAPELSALLGQSVVIDNRPGAGGTLGIGQVVRARPDGLTLALVSASSIPINKALYRNIPFDPARDLTLLTIAGSTPNALIVPAGGGIDSLAGLIARARQPGQPPLRHFSPGNGTSQHLSCAQLAMLTGIAVENVPYRGPAEGVTGLMAGETQFGFASVPSVAGLIRDGRLKALGTTGPRPSTLLAGVPTLVSLGYPAFGDTDIWYGFAGQRELPTETQTQLRAAFDRVLADAGLKERLRRAGFDAVPPATAAQLDAFVQAQVAFWAELVRSSGATMD